MSFLVIFIKCSARWQVYCAYAALSPKI